MFKYYLYIFYTPVLSHLIFNQPQVWGINNGLSLEQPLDQLTPNWMCAGRNPDTNNVINFVAGNTYSFQTICGEKNLNAPGCLIGDWHTGNNNNDYSGCALSISYSDYKNPNNHMYLSYSRDCPKRGVDTTFVISSTVRNCDLCVCSWAWAPSRKYSSPAQFYHNCFYCSVTGGGNNLVKFDFINVPNAAYTDVTYNDILQFNRLYTLPLTTIPITSGNRATLTVFNDQQMQCGRPQQGQKLAAINPILLGFTVNDWINKYATADPSQIPWCGKKITLTVNGNTDTFTIMDTCQPCSGTGCGDATPCDYTNVIDIWNGDSILQRWVGDDFFQGTVQWSIDERVSTTTKTTTSTRTTTSSTPRTMTSTTPRTSTRTSTRISTRTSTSTSTRTSTNTSTRTTTSSTPRTMTNSTPRTMTNSTPRTRTSTRTSTRTRTRKCRTICWFE